MYVRLLALLVAFSTGCAGLFSTGYCDLHCQDREPVDHHDNSNLAVPLLIGAAAAIAVLVIATRDDAPEAARPVVVAPPPAPMQTASAELRLQRMFVQGQMSARAGRCEATIAIERQLARTSKEDHAAYVADPVIATCLR